MTSSVATWLKDFFVCKKVVQRLKVIVILGKRLDELTGYSKILIFIFIYSIYDLKTGIIYQNYNVSLQQTRPWILILLFSCCHVWNFFLPDFDECGIKEYRFT